MKKITYIIMAFVISLLGVLWVSLTPIFFPSVHAEEVTAAPHAGFMAPPFELQTSDNRNLSLTNYEGKPRLVFFWASWCSVCKATMPGLQKVYETFQEDGFKILAINSTSQDNLQNALQYYQAQGYTFPMLLDQDGEAAYAYQIRALPTAVLINSDGTISEVIIGSGVSQGYLTAALSSLFEGKE